MNDVAIIYHRIVLPYHYEPLPPLFVSNHRLLSSWSQSTHIPPISSLLSFQSILRLDCSILIGGGYMVHRMLWCTIIVDRRESTETSAPRPSIFTSDSLPSCTINSASESHYTHHLPLHIKARGTSKSQTQEFSIHPRAR